MVNKNDISKIGIGTWGVGGLDKRNPENNDDAQIEGMTYAIQKGENFIEANLWYAEGHAANLAAEALRRSDKKREDIFLSHTVYTQSAPTLESAKEEWRKFTELFGTDYVDTLQISIKNLITYGKERCVEMLNEMLESKKTRFVSITNADLATLQWIHGIFKEKLFSHEIIHNFEIRASQDTGAINYASENDILNVIAQPLRRNRSINFNWPLLAKLANKYKKTQNQIIINWLAAKNYLVIIKTINREHIDENLAALEFKMDDEDIRLMDEFRPPDFVPPETDWYWTGKGVPAHMLPNVFDEEYQKQMIARRPAR